MFQLEKGEGGGGRGGGGGGGGGGSAVHVGFSFPLCYHYNWRDEIEAKYWSIRRDSGDF